MRSRISKVLAAGIIGCALMAVPVDSNAAEVKAGADVLTSYVFRGVTINADPVIQPYLNVTHPSGVGLKVWSNFDLGDDDAAFEKREFSETRFIAHYKDEANAFRYKLGYIEYTFPGVVSEDGIDATANREVFVGATTELTPDLDAGITGYYEFEDVRDFYVSAKANYSLAVTEELSVGAHGHFGFAGKDFALGDNSGAHDYLLGVSSTFALRDDTNVRAFVNYVDTARTKTLPDEFVRENWVGGLGINHTF